MGFDDILKLVFGGISCFGVICVLFIFTIKLCIEKIAESLQKKYSLKFDKELEKYKSSLDNKNYITKTQFDAEFDLYRNLSASFFSMVQAITNMIPAGYATYPADKKEKEEYENKLYNTAVSETVIAQKILYSNVAFIPKNLYEKYKEILDLCGTQIDVFQQRWNVGYLATQEEKKKFSREDYQRSRDISKKFFSLNDDLREYLSKLEIAE